MSQADLFGDPRIEADRALWRKREASLRKEWAKLAGGEPIRSPEEDARFLEAFMRACVPAGLR